MDGRNKNAMLAEYGPNNQYTVSPYDQSRSIYMNQDNNPMPPRDRHLMGAAGAGAIGGGGGFGLAGANLPGVILGGAGGAVAGMGYEALIDAWRRAPKRHAYNNEYTGVPQNFAPPYSGGEY